MMRLVHVSCIAALLIVASCSRKSDSAAALRKAGEAAFLEKDYTQARKYFTAALAKTPSDKHLLYFAGLSYKYDMLYDSALFYLKRADLLYPKDREINKELYEVARKLEKWDDAIKAVLAMIVTGDGWEDHYLELAELNARSGAQHLALYYQRKYVETHPDDEQEWARFISVAMTIDSLDMAAWAIDSAIARFGPKESFISSRGMLNVHLRNFPDAERIFRSLAAKDTANVGLRVNVANVLASYNVKAKKLEALEIFRRIPQEQRDAYMVDSLIAELERELQ